VAGAGFAFFGAAATRMIDIARDDARRMRAAAAIWTRHAGSPTWRSSPEPPSTPELVATIANALAHHGSRVDPDEVAVNVAAVIRSKDNGESRRWLLAQVESITAELDRSLPGK
jgi:hypothetical protein